MRRALCPGRPQKPSILVSKSFGLFLGNFTPDEMVLQAGEIFGFNVGAFQVQIVRGAAAQPRKILLYFPTEVKQVWGHIAPAFSLCLWLIAGTGHQEATVLPWRLTSDMTLVAYEKVAMPLSSFLCKMARERGIAEFSIWDHDIEPKMQTVSFLSVQSTVTVTSFAIGIL